MVLCEVLQGRRRQDLLACDTSDAGDAHTRAVHAQAASRARATVRDGAAQLVGAVGAAIARIAVAAAVLAQAAIGAAGRTRDNELACGPFVSSVAVAHAMAAHAMRVALLWTALDDGAIVTVEAREAKATTAPAIAL